MTKVVGKKEDAPIQRLTTQSAIFATFNVLDVIDALEILTLPVYLVVRFDDDIHVTYVLPTDNPADVVAWRFRELITFCNIHPAVLAGELCDLDDAHFPETCAFEDTRMCALT